MEFLRFGSSIPGAYWGCCAVCIIQNFKVDPDSKASIQLVSGDGGGAIGDKFCGPTYRDIFKERIRIGTFSSSDMPNHAFFAVLTESQICGGVGRKWMEILKEEGFEFLRTTDNSVYTGSKVDGSGRSPHPNHIFALFRNISGSRIKDPFTPPKAWTDLKQVTPESWELIDAKDRVRFADAQSASQLKHWNDHGPTKLMSKAELVKAGVPITLAGLRSPNPQESEAERLRRQEHQKQAQPKAPSAFPAPAAASVAA